MMLRRSKAVRALAMGLVWAIAGTLARSHAEPPADSRTRDPLLGELEQVRETGSLAPGALDSIALQLEIAGRIRKDYPAQADGFRARARRWLDEAKQGRDPLQAARGQIAMRGYSSPISQVRQGYAVYLPKNYDPARSYPLMVVLHGGSANGNLFLGVVLGNNMNWKEYDQHLWDDFTPRFHPDWIVVAPDGFGHVMWRFMGEQDVLDVLDDVQKHYHVDTDRVVLCGLSNGGVGAYSLGMRHASRFSAVIAIAGAPSWSKYAGGGVDRFQSEALTPLSATALAENAINTDFRFFHGQHDPGPMRPAFVEAFGKHIATLGVPYKEKWFDAGHDLLYLVHRHGALFEELAKVKRNPHPKEVRLVAGDYRAARQHWLEVTRIDRLPELARVRAVASDSEVNLETHNTSALELAWRDLPLTAADHLKVVADGQVVYDAGVSGLGERLALVREATGWKIGTPQQPLGAAKQPGSAGPITDAYYRSLLHVYGTKDPAATDGLRKTAEKGARGWPLWLWRVEQRVLADSEVTAELMRDHDLVLYGSAANHALLERVENTLPIKVDGDAIVAGDQRYTGRGVGAKFIHPNPLQPSRYLIVQTAPTLEGVQAGHNLPDFLPDYVVYDAKSTRSRPRLVFPGGSLPLALGYFDASWHIDPSHTQRALNTAARTVQNKSVALNAERPAADSGNDPESAAHDRPPSPLPVPVAPVPPDPPQVFATEPDTQAGKAARELARRVASFTNYRSTIAGATWKVDPAVPWSIRERESCLADLATRDIPVEPWSRALPTPVATPVTVRAAIGGVTFRFLHAAPGLVIACELATRLQDIAAVVSRHGVHTVHVMSAYRDHPFPSFHTLGLALDLSRFDTNEGALVVKSDFVIDRNRETCDPESGGQSDKHKRLRAIACDLAESRRFSSVLTPNYNAGHRDHFHIDIRPDDPRLFLR
ncbi:MAG: extensin family protein [Polyangiales bacterium]